MHTYSNLWEFYISEENIRESVRKSSLGKRDRPACARIFYDLDNKIGMIRDYAEHFENAEHRAIEIYDGVQRKKRTIIVPLYMEQIVHHMVVRTLNPMFTRGMYEHSYGSIPGRGAHSGKKTIEKWIRRGGRNIKYCLKMDIHHFFASISHDIIKGMLKAKIRDDRFLAVVNEIVDAYPEGLPLGFYTSQWLANWYLEGLDHFIKEDLGAVFYIRYMDDMVIFGSNKRKLHKMREQIAEYISARLGLELKDNWQVFRFHNVDKEGNDRFRPLDFMGFIFYRNRTVLRKSIILKAERKARSIKGKTGHVTSHDARQILSYLGWIDGTDTYGFYLQRIKPNVSFRKMRKKVSREAKRKNKRGEEKWK